MEVTRESIMKMSLTNELECASFEVDNTEILLKKYKEIRDSSAYLDEETKKVLSEFTEKMIKRREMVKGRKQLMELMATFLEKSK